MIPHGFYEQRKHQSGSVVKFKPELWPEEANKIWNELQSKGLIKYGVMSLKDTKTPQIKKKAKTEALTPKAKTESKARTPKEKTLKRRNTLNQKHSKAETPKEETPK